MCSGSKSKHCTFDLVMEVEFRDPKDSSSLLELAAANDFSGFVAEVEQKGFDVDEVSLWYGRKVGSKKMGNQQRTPLMVASMYGSTEVLKYIVGTGKVDLNRVCGSDGATALHCAAAGGSDFSFEVVKILLGASADHNLVDAYGNKAADLIPSFFKFPSNLKRKELEMFLKGISSSEASDQEEGKLISTPRLSKEGAEKKEYPVDISLPDINNGIYGTDEFRMYSFKVNPCSRAYSHDWTECPFVHPGENARRRDPRKYIYSCVPCPEFKKGSCVKGDSCEYAHGVFECWLHPAQYRTRLCKDETGCSRKVCFFAHKSEELRPLYPSTGSAMPSPKSVSVNSMDISSLSPLALRSASMFLPATSTPPMSPSAPCSSPMSGNLWQNKINVAPPTLQLPGSRLKAGVSARDLELELELLGMESIHTRQQLIDEMSGLSSPSYWNNDYSRIGDLKPTNLDDVFGSIDPSLLSQLQGLSPKIAASSNSQLKSPTRLQMRPNMNQFRSSYPSNLSSSPARKLSGFDSSGAVAAAVMNSRSSAFAKRSQSFIDRGETSYRPGFTASANSAGLASSTNLSGWNSPDGKLEWGISCEQMNKLKKSASFGFRNGNMTTKTAVNPTIDEPDVSWVNSLVKDVSSTGVGLYSSEKKHGGVHEMFPPWAADQLYIDQEQVMA